MAQNIQAWRILIGVFGGFWLLFAGILIFNGFPFLIISMALTTIAILSILVIVLAWAYQNNL
ncbi:hypothetical protein [Tengunoibacter tsumagoiensis]|uniref:Uncharacterized protein n=1 Tax=Tengunoibacter tsumagoiensis TaxID=2014871 RepID=A0A402A332_9CHLR|nr:hypothetical protein [Tengunoibacter tsumagoiensis]GCE13544.1 hypothetical protein KTT_34030 [Tengunoibacter tsumagoiensis]